MHKKLLLACLAALVLFLAMQGTVLAETPDVVQDPHALSEAIQAAHDQGILNKEDPEGYLGIPGAPQINLLLAFFWACLVGWVFSTVGAFGGILAGVGHITIYGLGDYADTFKGTSAELNTAVTDTIRVGNQFLVGFSALVSTINYYKLGRLVAPVGIALAAGSILGSYLVPTLTAGRISFAGYVGFFGIFVLVLGCYMLYQTTPRGQKNRQKAKAAADAFEATMKRKRSGEAVDTSELGVKVTSLSAKKMSFTFYGVEFSFNPLFPVLGGFVIAAIASFLGVGGGFMLVPFITAIAGLPMYLAAGTSALAVLVGMITSILSYLAAGVLVHWPLIGTQLVGIFVGSMVGPRTSQYIPDKVLTRIFIVLAFYVGLNYIARGFIGKDIISLITGG
ncbi:MAG: sulfite exporter TauE/SafE family protein [Desulfosalsimonadaceae bacterium]